MKLVCSKTLLVEGLNIVSKAVATRPSMPILECCLLTADEDGNLKLMANDMEMVIQTGNIESEVAQAGSVALDLKVFSDIIRRMPGSHVEISADEKYLTVLKSGKSEFKILGMNPDEYPALPDVMKNQSYKIPAADLRNMIRQTVFSVSQDNTRPVLCGQLIEIGGDVVKIIAVDGFRIAMREGVLENEGQMDTKVIVPGKAMSEISKILPTDGDAVVTFYVTDKHILFDLGNCIVVSRLLEGEFVNYDNMFTNETSTLITAVRTDFMESIDRATLISKDSKKSPVKLKVADSSIAISSNTEMGASYEEITVMQDGIDLEIAFNPRYLVDVMKVLESEKITISFTSSLSPCIIRVEGSEDYKYLVLPLRLRG